MCAAIFLLALAARLAAVTWVGWTSVTFGDAPAYLFAARELVRTGQYPVSTEPFQFRSPGYPFFLAAATFGHPDSVPLVKATNALMGAAAMLVLLALSARIFRRRRVAIVTGVAAALYPTLISLSTDVASEPLFLLLLLSGGFLLLVAGDRPSSNLALLSGAVIAAAALTRPSALILVPLLATPVLDRRHPLRVRWHIAGSALLGCFLTLAPWTLRNALVFHEFVPVNDAAGLAFYEGNSDWMVRFYELNSREEYAAWSRAMFADLERHTSALAALGQTSPGERSRYFFSKAIEERSGNPVGWFHLLMRKSWDFLRPYPSPLFWPTTVVLTVGAAGTAATLLAILGFSGSRRRGVRLFSLAVLVLTFAAHVALIALWRYRIPYWDPILLLYAAPGGARLLSR
ncbi:MAG: glycosyltransferase family 39 protein [Acidobacteriota bacterium]